MDRTGAALRDATPELGARQAQGVAQDPKEGHIRRDVDLSPFAIDCEGDHERAPFLQGSISERVEYFIDLTFVF